MAVSSVVNNNLLNVNSLAPSKSLFETLAANETGNNGSIPFSDYLTQAVNNTNQLLLDSDQAANDFAAGKTDKIHQVEIAAQKADIALQFTMQVRNKILDAYNEIMRMQI
jgi:flagellar hook-basal body complex protein FliE